MKASWTFGYDASLKGVAPAPNGLGMMKLLCAGQISVLLFPMASALAVLRQQMGQYNLSSKVAVDALQPMDGDKLLDLQAKGCEATFATQGSNELLYVPAGWLCAEFPSKGVLVHGLRKTILPKCDSCAHDYETLIGCNKAEGKSVVRMVETHELMHKDGGT